MRFLAKRLQEGDDLKGAIEAFVKEEQLSSATVVSAVGSLNNVRVRMAGASANKQDIRTYNGPFEVVSLIGNLGQKRTHLHISFSDREGIVRGGHLKEGSIVHTTVELVVVTDDKVIFGESPDPDTGFGELDIKLQQA